MWCAGNCTALHSGEEGLKGGEGGREGGREGESVHVCECQCHIPGLLPLGSEEGMEGKGPLDDLGGTTPAPLEPESEVKGGDGKEVFRNESLHP